MNTEFEERLRFETFLAEISTRFVNVRAGEVDREIANAQRRICELLDIDRSTLWHVPEEETGTLLLTHFHQPPGSLLPPERMNLKEFFPWVAQKVLGGEGVTISKMTDLPPEAGRDRESFGLYGTKSGVYIPLSVGEGPVFALLTFASLREEKSWPETALEGFKLIAQVFANALARKRSDLALRESEERLALAADAAEAGVWRLDYDSGVFWATGRARALFGYAPDEIITMDRLRAWVHPDDWDLVRRDIERSASEGAPVDVEYRIVPPGGSERWIISRGRPARDPAGRVRWLTGLSVDVTERKAAEMESRERLEFETLIADLSSRFVNLPASEVDREILDAERRISELLDLDIVAFWQWSDEGPGCFLLTHYHSSQEGPRLPDQSNSMELFPWFQREMRAGRIVSISSLEDLPPEAALDREICRQLGVRSNLSLPLAAGGAPVFGALGLNTSRAERVWSDEFVKRAQLVGQIFANALARKRADEQIKRHVAEIEKLKQRLESENIYLREEVKLRFEHTEIMGRSLPMKRILAQAEQVAQTDSTVLLQGETGTGKELLARAIHEMSSRKDRPLITVNCASLPPTLVESELFGREKGAYTGAMTRMIGRFEIADGSTLFLDEIGEFPLDLQSKLLRVLEEGSFERLGSTKPLHVNVRIIAATNRDIEQGVKDGKFRRDLFYRLNVFPIVIPPLRERPEDIPSLVRAVVKEFQKRMGKEIESIQKKTMQALQSYSWPGNVRELRNLIEHAMILSKDKTLDIDLPKRASSETDATGNLQDMERMHIVAVLEKTGWRIAGQGGAAEVLGLKRTTLQEKMKKLGIKRSNKTMPD